MSRRKKPFAQDLEEIAHRQAAEAEEWAIERFRCPACDQPKGKPCVGSTHKARLEKVEADDIVDERDATRIFSCPKCGVRPGVRCKGDAGTHKPRINLLEADHDPGRRVRIVPGGAPFSNRRRH